MWEHEEKAGALSVVTKVTPVGGENVTAFTVENEAAKVYLIVGGAKEMRRLADAIEKALQRHAMYRTSVLGEADGAFTYDLRHVDRKERH